MPRRPEFLINDYTTGSQGFPRVAIHSSGSFVVVWDDYGRDGSEYGIFARIFDTAGSPVGSSFQVNTATLDYQRLPAIGMDSAGGFVVVWEHRTGLGQGTGGGYDIRAQRFDSSGGRVGAELQVNAYTTDAQRKADVSMDDGGSFVVVWQSGEQDGSLYGVFGRRFDSSATPVGGEFQVNSYTTGDQGYPRVSMSPSGAFVIAWMSYRQDGSGGGVRARRYDSSGSPLGGEFQVNAYVTSDQFYPVVEIDALGSFVIAWDSTMQDGEGAGIFMRRFDSMGTPVSGDMQVNSYTTNYQAQAAISGDDAGNFVVTWNSFDQAAPGSYYDIFGQLFDDGGARVGGEFQVSTYTTDYQRLPAVSMSESGDFVVVWDSFDQDGDASGIFGQDFTAGPADLDGDGVPDPDDNCPSIPNHLQDDFDGDGVGDECDPDIDGDGTADTDDLCVGTPAAEIVNPSTGCSIGQLCPCAGPEPSGAPWRNHRQYVRCVGRVSMDFLSLGIFTRRDKSRTVHAASSSDCGRQS